MRTALRCFVQAVTCAASLYKFWCSGHAANTKDSLVCGQPKTKNILVFGSIMSVLARRLKEARLSAGLSQERLGVLAGLDEMSSSARMNQYERGKHQPDYSMVERWGQVLSVPESYFFTKDDDAAWLQVAFHRMSAIDREKMIGFTRSLSV